MPMIVFAGAMDLAQRALEILNLALIVDLLAFGQFQRLEHFFHLFERMFQFLDDAVDLIDGFADRRLLVLLLGLGMMSLFGMFPTFPTVAAFLAITTILSFTPFGAFLALGAFSVFRVLNLLGVFGMFSVLRVFMSMFMFMLAVLLVGMLSWFRGHFFRCFRVFSLGGCGRITGRGQGTTVLAITAAAGMASATASGSAPATRGCCRIRLLRR